jgi:hypothetical protein
MSPSECQDHARGRRPLVDWHQASRPSGTSSWRWVHQNEPDSGMVGRRADSGMVARRSARRRGRAWTISTVPGVVRDPMRQAIASDQSEWTSHELVALAGNEPRNAETSEPVNDWDRRRPNSSYPEPVHKWRGPVAFAGAYGSVLGIDHAFGMRWGSNRDQRVSIRVELGCEQGLLDVYDPTWDEYAVIGTDCPLAAVETAFAGALQFGEHGAVEDFVALLARVSPVRPALGPEL